MAKFEQRPNTGVLFKNLKKETEKHPDYTGNIDIEGTAYRLAAWIKKGKKGAFMSLAVSDNTGGEKSRQQEKVDDWAPF